MTILVRPAVAADAQSMAELLNAIVERGGTTALTRRVERSDLQEWMDASPNRSAWHVAQDDTLEIVGFQWLEPDTNLPASAADIASFVQMGRTGLGIGTALFEATAKTARALGYAWINANIRADNEGGLAYYQSRGFRTYGRLDDVELADGTRVDKILMRFDLD